MRTDDTVTLMMSPLTRPLNQADTQVLTSTVQYGEVEGVYSNTVSCRRRKEKASQPHPEVHAVGLLRR